MTMCSSKGEEGLEVMVVTGEASGDLHGANLVRAMKKIDSSLRFSGMGGPELASLGMEILFDAQHVSVVGLVEVISRLPSIITAQKILRKRLKSHHPALLIIIDLPDFNLILAKKAKQLGIPVFYYITPQVWAWREGRVTTISKRVDQLGVILPFEEQFFQERGVTAQYVGHPLLDHVCTVLSKKEFCDKYKIDNQSTCVGLLPGSRSKEISSLLPDFLQAAVMLQEKATKPLVFLLPLAPTITKEELEQQGLEYYKTKIDIRVISDDRYELMKSCDVVVAASGTVTLELAILGVPMLVVYRTSPVSYWLGRKLIKLRWFSLVNLIAQREIVKELLQDEVTPTTISDELLSLLKGSKREQVIQGLQEVNNLLGCTGASERAAKVALEMLA